MVLIYQANTMYKAYRKNCTVFRNKTYLVLLQGRLHIVFCRLVLRLAWYATIPDLSKKPTKTCKGPGLSFTSRILKCMYRYDCMDRTNIWIETLKKNLYSFQTWLWMFFSNSYTCSLKYFIRHAASSQQSNKSFSRQTFNIC